MSNGVSNEDTRREALGKIAENLKQVDKLLAEIAEVANQAGVRADWTAPNDTELTYYPLYPGERDEVETDGNDSWGGWNSSSCEWDESSTTGWKSSSDRC